MRLFDSHCHLQDERLATDIDGVLRRARAADVAGFCCCGAAESDWDGVARLAAANGDIVPAYGLHPWYVRDRTAAWSAQLRRMLENDVSAAVGEIGLDHALGERNDEEQAAAFVEQLRLARELGRPASVHCRRAWDALLRCLREAGGPPAGLVVHSYSGSRELIEPLSGYGARFSFSGSITYAGNRRGRSALQAVPIERLLIETDAPDIYPNVAGAGEAEHGAPRERPLNEPALLPLVLHEAAHLRGMAVEALAEQLWANAADIFLRC